MGCSEDDRPVPDDRSGLRLPRGDAGPGRIAIRSNGAGGAGPVLLQSGAMCDARRESVAFTRLVRIIQTLRGPDGCPWDRRQTLADIGRYVVEEAAEVADAIVDGDGEPTEEVCEELGDLMMTILLAARVCEEQEAFSIDDVARLVGDKLIRRHPHVFGETTVEGADDVVAVWDEIKRREKEGQGRPPPTSRLDGVPRSLAPLARAYKISARAARAGFDWPSPLGSLEKVREELQEVTDLLDEEGAPRGRTTVDELRDELGDVLFAAVNLCRQLDVHPDDALRATIAKFDRRFRRLEREFPDLESRSLEEMDRIWDEMRPSRVAGSAKADPPPRDEERDPR